MFTLNTAASTPAGTFTLDEGELSWPSDKDKFKQPQGFSYVEVANDSVSCTSANLPSDCKSYYDASDDKYYLFYYPEDSATQYLYESYPDHISPIVGVTDEHFKVWMRTAAMPRFRKLYGRIHSDLHAGDQVVFNINANYEVTSYDATKGLVITNLGEFGAKNPYLGVAYIVVGSISMFFALLFAMKQFFAPRAAATIEMLDWKN